MTWLCWQKEGESFFSRREYPFSDTDVKDPKPIVKQTPVMRYAQGTALFIKARNAAPDEEGECRLLCLPAAAAVAVMVPAVCVLGRVG